MTSVQPLLDDLARHARELEPTSADIEAILQRAHGPKRHGLRTGRSLAVTGSLVLLLVAALMAVPVTRTALGNAVDAFFGGLTPDHPVNGQPLTGSQVPQWMRAETKRALVVAGTGKDRLIAYRDHGAYCFLYGASVGECADGHEWARELAQYPVVLRGPTGGVGHPLGALYGFTRGDVSSVRLTFATRPPVTANARTGGFAISTDARWQPQELELRDVRGHPIATINVAGRFSAYR
jgi:hypothetical protein